MGIEKAGLQLGKEIIAWAKVGKNLLATKPVKVNTAGLRLAHPLEGDVVQVSKTIQKRAGTILNTKTGLQEPITFSDLPKEMKIDDRSVYYMSAYNSSKERIGEVSFKLLEEPSCLYINSLGTSGEYKGIGSEIIRKLVQLSDRLGIGGRIRLDACTGHIPPTFRFKGFTDKCKVSAAIKYKKMGFVANRKWIDDAITKEISAGGNGIGTKKTSGLNSFEYYYDKFGGTGMYLSEDAIHKFLQPI